MNKNYRQGAEDVAGVAAKGFNAVGDETKGIADQLAANAQAQHRINEGLANALKEIAYGFSSNGNARNMMSPEGKMLLISALRHIKASSDWLSQEASMYYDYFFTILDVKPLLQSQFDPEKLGYLGQKDVEYVLYTLLEYKAFLTDETALIVADDIISNINISPKRRSMFELSVEETVRDIELKGILNKYDSKAVEIEASRLRNELEEAKREKEAYRDQLEEARREAAELKRREASGVSEKILPKRKKDKSAIKANNDTKNGLNFDTVAAIGVGLLIRGILGDPDGVSGSCDNDDIIVIDDDEEIVVEG